MYLSIIHKTYRCNYFVCFHDRLICSPFIQPDKPIPKKNESTENIYIFFLFNRGLVPAVAEMRYLDRVKWLDLYGVDLHPVLVSSFYLDNNILPIPGCQNVNFQKTSETVIVSVCLFVCLVSGTWIFFFFSLLIGWSRLPGSQTMRAREKHT